VEIGRELVDDTPSSRRQLAAIDHAELADVADALAARRGTVQAYVPIP